MDYIQDKGYAPASACYSETIHQPANPMDLDSLVMNLYIEVDRGEAAQAS